MSVQLGLDGMPARLVKVTPSRQDSRAATRAKESRAVLEAM